MSSNMFGLLSEEQDGTDEVLQEPLAPARAPCHRVNPAQSRLDTKVSSAVLRPNRGLLDAPRLPATESIAGTSNLAVFDGASEPVKAAADHRRGLVEVKAIPYPAEVFDSSSTEPMTRRAKDKPRRRYAAPKLPPYPLDDATNSYALSLWRAGQAPTTRCELPQNFDPRSQTKDPFTSRHGQAFPMVDFVATRTSTYIALDTPQSSKGKTTALIWGRKSDAEDAKLSLWWWVKRCFPSTPYAAFGKIPSLTVEEITQIEIDIKREEARNRYRRNVPENVPFAFNLHVKLDAVTEELKALLGANFEALDRIRCDCFCYITYIPHSQHAELQDTFQVVGNNEQSVREACRRLFGIVHQQDARQLDRPTWWAVKQCNALGTFIKLAPYLPASAQRPSSVIHAQVHDPAVTKCPMKPRFECSSGGAAEEHELDYSTVNRKTVRVGTTDVESVNLCGIEATVISTLDTLTSYKGHLRMRATLGQCLFTKYPREAKRNKVEYTLDEFETLLDERNREENQLEGHITQELGDEQLGGAALMRLRKSTTLFSCDLDSSTGQSTGPVHSATMIVADQTQTCFQLELEWQRVSAGEGFQLKKRMWLRLEPHAKTMVPLMDVNAIDLEGGLSYHLGITAAHAIDDARIPQHWHDFVDEISLITHDDTNPDPSNIFVRLPRDANGAATIPLLSCEQKRAWRFSSLSTDYIVELASVQDVNLGEGKENAIASEARWGVSMWHPRWDLYLPKNARLGLGERAPWKPQEWFLFPAREIAAATGSAGETSVQTAERLLFHGGTGFKTLFEHLKSVEDVLMGKDGQKS